MEDSVSLDPKTQRGNSPWTNTPHDGLSLVLPCFNEELNIEPTVCAASDWMRRQHIDGQIVVTDDGSSDGSPDVLRGLLARIPHLKVVRHDVRRGYGAAVRSGCDHADKPWIAFMDSDGQFDPADLSRLMAVSDEVGFVAGVRRRRADHFQRWLNSRLYQFLVRVVLGVRVSDLNCGMKLFRRSAWGEIRPVYGTGATFNAELFYSLKNAHIPWTEVDVPHYPRLNGKPTGASLLVILRAFKELWRVKWASKSRLNTAMQSAPAAVAVAASVAADHAETAMSLAG